VEGLPNTCKDLAEACDDILGQEAQDQVSSPLKLIVLAPIAAIAVAVLEVEVAVQLERDLLGSREEVDLARPASEVNLASPFNTNLPWVSGRRSRISNRKRSASDRARSPDSGSRADLRAVAARSSAFTRRWSWSAMSSTMRRVSPTGEAWGRPWAGGCE
jgi:hypothetical protein